MKRRRRNPRAYHGTEHLGPAEPPSFDVEREAKVWNVFGGSSVRRTGIFLTGSKKFAQTFGKRLMNCNVRFRRVARLDKSDDLLWEFHDSIDPYGSDRNLWISSTPEYRKVWEYFDDELGRRFVAWLRKKGYDGVAFREVSEDDDGREVEATTYVAFDRSQVKCEGRELPPRKNPAKEKFWAAADEQRGEAEETMVRAQRALGGGVLSYAIEHVGDLYHRMAEEVTWRSMGYENVESKVERVLRTLRHRYGFAREHRENMESSARHEGIPVEAYERRARHALRAYAEAHERLPVYNRAMLFARRAAIALGKERFWDAENALAELERHLGSESEWVRFARLGVSRSER